MDVDDLEVLPTFLWCVRLRGRQKHLKKEEDRIKEHLGNEAAGSAVSKVPVVKAVLVEMSHVTVPNPFPRFAMHVHLLAGLKNFVTQCCDVNQGSDITPAKSDWAKSPVRSPQHIGGVGMDTRIWQCVMLVLSHLLIPTVPLPTMPTMPCFAVVTSTDFLEHKSEQWQRFSPPCALRFFKEGSLQKQRSFKNTHIHGKFHFRFKKCSGV